MLILIAYQGRKKAETFFFIENLNFLYFNGDEHASQIFDDGNTLDAKDPYS